MISQMACFKPILIKMIVKNAGSYGISFQFIVIITMSILKFSLKNNS